MHIHTMTSRTNGKALDRNDPDPEASLMFLTKKSYIQYDMSIFKDMR